MENKRKTSKKVIRKNKTLKNKKDHKIIIVETFISMLNTVKLFHWKTYSYSTHEATDKLYKELNEHIDEFIEVMLGKNDSRIPNFVIHPNLVNDPLHKTFKKQIHKYRDFLIKLDKYFNKQDTDLLSIRDDILGNINQFLYLLTFDK